MVNPSTCTVVIPAYNAAQYIEETINSVLENSEILRELIIVDDGSTDGTSVIVSRIANTDQRIRLVRTENAGVSSARNTGLSLTTSPFICFLDADDTLTADALEHLGHALGLNPAAAAAYGDVQYIDEKSRRYAISKNHISEPPKTTVNLTSILQRNFIDTPGAVMFRTDAIRQAGGFDSNLSFAEDWEAYVRVASFGVFVYCGKRVINYRLHGSSALSRKRLTLSDFEAALLKVFGKPGELYGISTQTLKIYEYRMRVKLQAVIILKSKGFRTQLCNIKEIVVTLFHSNREASLIRATLKAILSAVIRVI